MPFFRKSYVTSAYEYLEKRFAPWARYYAAAGYTLLQIVRMGIILYAVSLPIQILIGLRLETIILFLGVFVSFYTIGGGLKAVVWTDMIQGISLTIGALIILPIILIGIPGGIGELFSVAWQDHKFSLGSMDWDLTQRGFWVMLLTAPYGWLQIMCSDQSIIQRYCAPKTKKEAKRAIIVGAVGIPLSLYFIFVGTALYVFYQAHPSEAIQNLEAPEQIVPFFVMTEIPDGLAGFVIAGLVSAALSTLSSLINAVAATTTSDFYRRLFVRHRDEKHYLKAGRWFSTFFSFIMIFVALYIHWARTQTLNDIFALMTCILGGGILGLFMLGFLTKSVGNMAAMIATATTFLGVCFWTFVKSGLGQKILPELHAVMPDPFWMPLVTNFYLFTAGLLLAFLVKRKPVKDLTNLTIWTSGELSHKD